MHDLPWYNTGLKAVPVNVCWQCNLLSCHQ